MTTIKLTQVITDLTAQLESVNGSIEEYDEMYGEEGVDAMDASGGNFDDAYSLGLEHGEMFERSSVLYDVIKRLKEVTQ